MSDAPAPTAPSDPCPPTPQADAPEALGFTPRPMVRWFAPGELVRAGVKATLSSLFGAYADRREVQALQAAQRTALDGLGAGDGAPATLDDRLAAREVCDYSGRDELWVDYVADLGDGFDATYSIARLLAEPALDVGGHGTRRGQVLVMGGDQVYPTATREAYRDRLVGPYRAALPCAPEAEAPHLFAVPGNHDWYDGLTSFIRLFCHRRWIGGWQTQQRRSYFACKLPHGWWLWGIDVQLDSDVDLPQFQYFEGLASDPELMPPGSKVILCTAEPSWVFARTKGEHAYQNLAYFERKILHRHGHEHVVGLAGDWHCYARYEETPAEAADRPAATGPRQRFISGGGGAYLYPTHQLPEAIETPAPDGGRDRYTLLGADGERHTFPSADDSRGRARRVLALPLMNRGFAAVLGAFYLFFAWLTQSATKQPGLDVPSFMENLAALAFPWQLPAAVAELWRIVAHSPGSMLLLLLLAGGLIGFAKRTGGVRIALGLAHTAAHTLTALLLIWGFSELNLGVLGLGVDAPWQVLLFGAEMLLVGGLAGGFVFGLYLLLANTFVRTDQRLGGLHANEVFSAQSIPDFKHFLRLHVNPEGVLTIYAVGLRETVRRWRLHPEARGGAPWFEPEEGDLREQAELVEPPVVVRPARRPVASGP